MRGVGLSTDNEQEGPEYLREMILVVGVYGWSGVNSFRWAVKISGGIGGCFTVAFSWKRGF